MKRYPNLILIAAAVCAATSSLAAQARDEAATELETVLVTATRSPTSGQKLPVAWSSIQGDAIALTAPQHSNQLFQRSAGVWISRNNGQESLISLRSPVLTGAGSCGAFLTATDGIPLRAPGFCNVNQLFDANLAQAGTVEVIRGPATAVYGSNAMHGVINVLTASADTTRNALRMEAGSRDYYRVLAGWALPEYGSAINLQAVSYGGYQARSGYDQQKFSVRHDRTAGEWSLAGVLGGMNINQETAGYVQGDRIYRDRSASKDNPNPEAYRDAWSLRGHIAASRHLSDTTTLTVTPYFRANGMEFLQHFLPWQPVERNGHRSIGLQSSIAGTHDTVSWVIGADLDITRGWLDEIQAEPFSPNQPVGIHYDYEVDALVAGAFAQGSVELAERWRLDAGLRLEQTDYDYDNQTGTGDACAATASACRFYRPADRKDDFSNWSGNLALGYDLGNARVFARVARGFRAPQTSELYRLQAGQQVADLDSEQIDSFELGIRGQAGDTLSYAVNAYWMDKDEVIFQDRDRQNISGAKTEHRGVELELKWQINDVWYTEAVASIARHRYANAIELQGSRTNINGNDIDTAPRHFGSARLGADTTIGSVPFLAELELVWLDEYYVDPDNQNEYEGHELINLRIEWGLSPSLTASLVATNLADKRYAERADFGFGNYRYFVGEPRSAVFGLNYAFD